MAPSVFHGRIVETEEKTGPLLFCCSLSLLLSPTDAVSPQECRIISTEVNSFVSSNHIMLQKKRRKREANHAAVSFPPSPAATSVAASAAAPAASAFPSPPPRHLHICCSRTTSATFGLAIDLRNVGEETSRSRNSRASGYDTNLTNSGLRK